MLFPTVLVAVLSSAFTLFASATPIITSSDAHIVARTAAAPKMVIYTDDYINNDTGLPTAANLAGYNVLILAFLMVAGPVDQVQAFKQLSSSARTALKKSYNDAGITLMCSAFGSTDAPTSDGHDAATIANQHAAIVIELGLQGIDVDYEDMNAVNKADGKAEQWLITYTQTLRSKLPAGQYFITHAPVAPWFSHAYTAGAYWKVNEVAGNDIDWYNVQFYNQGDTQYTTCENLITQSGGDFPKTSVLEINSDGGVPLSKIVIGKPSAAYQAENGFVSFSTLSTCINQAAAKGWGAGIMLWEYETSMTPSVVSAVTKALAAIGGNDIPISPGTTTSAVSTRTKGSSTSTSTESVSTTESVATTTATHTRKGNEAVTTTSSAQPTTTSTAANVTGGSCSGVSPWSSSTTYTGGSEVSTGITVSYEGSLYTNKWWTQGDAPGSLGDADPWTKVGSCSSSKRMDSEEVAARNISRSRRNTHNNRLRRSHLARLNEMS